MPGSDKTVYKICREQAGYTQERAAELLNCSVRALARYESGETLVPDPVAYHMIQLYNSHYLGMEHLRLGSQVAAELLPPVEDSGLQTAVLRFFNLCDAAAKVGRELLRIAEDDKIDPLEREELDMKILPILNRIVVAAMEVCLAARKTHRTCSRMHSSTWEG